MGGVKSATATHICDRPDAGFRCLTSELILSTAIFAVASLSVVQLIPMKEEKEKQRSENV